MGFKWEFRTVNDCKVPKKALQGGVEVDGQEIYVGRVNYMGGYLPAKVIPKNRACYTSFNGQEIFVNEFEMIVGKADKFSWVPASYGEIVPNAVSVGAHNGEEMYVGRAPFNGSMVIGKIHRSHRIFYCPFNGGEHSLQHYEVLVYKDKKDKKKKEKRRGSKSSNSS
jgi:hypothetical protein